MPRKRTPSLLPTRRFEDRADPVPDHLAHDEGGFGALDALDREDARVDVEQVLGVAGGDPHHQVDLTAQAVRLDHFGDLGDLGRDAGNVGLAHDDAHHRLDGQPERRGRHRALERLEDTGTLEAGHARLHGVARQAETIGERDDGRPMIVGEGLQQLEVNAVQRSHSAQGYQERRGTPAQHAQD